jgi:DNA mismatch repair protein MutS
MSQKKQTKVIKKTFVKPKKPTLVDVYIENYNKYTEIYGEKTLVFIECGDFMEVYGYSEDDPQFTVCTDVLGLMISGRKKEDETSRYMSGIPKHSVKRHYKILLKNNYTIVLITQYTNPPDDTIHRKVTQILSAGCNLSEDIHDNTDHGNSVLISILIEIDEDGEYFMNYSTFDSNIGESKFYYISEEEAKKLEVSSQLGSSSELQQQQQQQSTKSINEKLLTLLHENIDKINYNEILLNIIYANDDINEQEVSNEIINSLNMDTKMKHIKFHNKTTIKNHYKNTYQNTFLEKHFPHYKNIYCSIKENLHIEKEDPLITINMMFLFEFVSMHDNSLVSSLSKPVIDSSTSTNHLKSFNETYSKLNIFESKMINSNKNSLFYFIDFTSTNSAKRLLVNTLKNPLINKTELEDKYDMIDEILVKPENIKKISDNLKIVDLDRIYRRFCMGKLCPYEIPRLIYSNEHINNLIDFVLKSKMKKIKSLLPTHDIVAKYKEYCNKINEIFDVEACSKINIKGITTNLFNNGINKEIDNIVNKIQEEKQLLTNIATHIEGFIENKICKELNYISVRIGDKEEHWLDIGKLRGIKIKTNLDKKIQTEENPTITFSQPDKKLLEFELKSVEYDTKNKSNIKIKSHQITTICKRVQELYLLLAHTMTKEYIKTIKSLYDEYYVFCIIHINKFISNVDLIKSNAKCAYTYKYCRPTIIDNKNNKSSSSSITAKDLRHPIIERLLIENGGKYVPNDIELSANKSNLLYGVNSVGKSSLLKSIAIAIILAQSGMYVPASECNISLYEKIFSRTGNDDNLFLNHSSFVKEMTEAREIIQKADNKSLVIADELCASTEAESALKIVSGIIKILSERGVSFVFATHMFKLNEVKMVKELKNIYCKHLKVNFNKDLHFERKITDGLPENRLYGLLVANKIIQNKEFCDVISSDVETTIQPTKTSNYNSKLYMDECQVCLYKPMKKTDIPLETHHINMQCHAVNNYHGNHHKNELHNLVVLCKSCHSFVHEDKINILGYKCMDSGMKLDYKNKLIVSDIEVIDDTIIESKKTSKKKYNDNDIVVIKNYYEQNSHKTKKEILDVLKKQHNYNLSNQIFNKILQNEY